MRPGRKDLRHRLVRMGQVPVPPPAPGFVARLEERFGAGHRVTVVADELALARSRRRAVRLGLVAAAAAGLLALAVPQGDQDVKVATHGVTPTTTSSTTTTALPTVEPTTTTTVAPAPLVTPTTTARPAPTIARPAPTTTTTAPAPVTTTTNAPAPVTTTTKPIARLDLRCAGAWEDTVAVVTCTWTGTDDPTFAGWRLHRSVNGAGKQVVFTSADGATRSYADRDVVAGGTYQYVVEAVSTAGRTLAKGGIVEVACCPR